MKLSACGQELGGGIQKYNKSKRRGGKEAWRRVSERKEKR
jgi:hypothetical protein